MPADEYDAGRGRLPGTRPAGGTPWARSSRRSPPRLDGYVTGPDDGPAAGLGIGGERLHYWVLGGPWTYDGRARPTGCTAPTRSSTPAWSRSIGAGVCGRGMYDAAGAWGGTNPFGGTAFVRHAPGRGPARRRPAGFRFVDGFDDALAAGPRGRRRPGRLARRRRRRDPAGPRRRGGRRAGDLRRPGGARRRQAPLRGFTRDLDLEIRSVHHSRVRRPHDVRRAPLRAPGQSPGPRGGDAPVDPGVQLFRGGDGAARPRGASVARLAPAHHHRSDVWLAEDGPRGRPGDRAPVGRPARSPRPPGARRPGRQAAEHRASPRRPPPRRRRSRTRSASCSS